jgi:hypothetical protein
MTRPRRAIFAVLAFAACSAQTTPKPVILRTVAPELRRDDRLEEAISTALSGMFDPDHRISYCYNRVDLNGDKTPEVLVYASGGGLCGSGGCMAFVFRAEGSRYTPVAEISLARTPVVVSSSATNG